MELNYDFDRSDFEAYVEFLDKLESVLAEVRSAVDSVSEGYEAIDDAMNETEAPRGRMVTEARNKTSEAADKLVARADDLMILLGKKGQYKPLILG